MSATEKLYNEEVMPIVNLIEDLLVEKKADQFMALLALAALLGSHIKEADVSGILSKLLAMFISQNLQTIIDKKARESN